MPKRRPECYVPYEPERTAPKPVPDGPALCQGCGHPLEPLRRWGGLCKACVSEMPHGTARVDAMTMRWVVIARFSRRGPAGNSERCVRARCTCGNERVMTASSWNKRNSLGCNKCRLKRATRDGVESDVRR